MSSRQQLYVLALHGGIAFAVVLSVTLLGLKGSIDAASVTAILGGALGLAGGTAASLGTVGATVNGKSTIDDRALADREHTLRMAFDAAAASQPHETHDRTSKRPGQEG